MGPGEGGAGWGATPRSKEDGRRGVRGRSPRLNQSAAGAGVASGGDAAASGGPGTTTHATT